MTGIHRVKQCVLPTPSFNNLLKIPLREFLFHFVYVSLSLTSQFYFPFGRTMRNGLEK